MGLLGKILATPVRILNVPARAIEMLIGDSSGKDDENNILNGPLESVAKAIEEIDD